MRGKLKSGFMLLCSFVMALSLLQLAPSVVRAAWSSNLTWPSPYPSGWSETGSGLEGSGSTLYVLSAETGSDFSYEADVTLNGSGTQASQGALIFRSSGGSINDSYVLFVNKTATVENLQLVKYVGGTSTALATVAETYNWNQAYHFKVVASGSGIKVYFEHETVPSIDISDSSHASGQYGLLRAGTAVTFNHVQASGFDTNLTWPSAYPSGWTVNSAGLEGSGSTNYVLSDETAADFSFTTEMTLNGSGSTASQGGIVIRSTGGSIADSYLIVANKTASTQNLELIKFVGGTATVLASVAESYNWNQTYPLKVTASGSNIQVYLDNETTPSIDVDDSAHSSGNIGLFRAGTAVTFNHAYAAIAGGGFATNLTWSSPYPSGWAADSAGIQGEGSILSFNADESADSFTYEADIALNGSGTQASQGGLILRSTGTSYYNSYIVWLHRTSGFQKLELQKFTGSASATTLASVDKTIDWDTVYHLKVVTYGTRIRVFFNNETTPSIEINDNAHLNGHYGLFRAGTAVTFNNVNRSDENDGPQGETYNLLSTQLGYQLDGDKLAYIRDTSSTKVTSGTTFDIVDEATDQVVYTGTVASWGEKWGSYWWKLDFSSFDTSGKFYIQVGATLSNAFYLGDTPLIDYDMVDIALNQLDERNNHGVPNTYNLNGSLRYEGRWLTLNGEYLEGIFRDCSSNFAEIESVGMTVLGLIDLYNYQKDRFSPTDQQRIKDYIELGADYLVASQRITSDPETNGRFVHSLLVNTFDGAAWAGNVYTWHDMAYAMVVLEESYKFVNAYNPSKAEAYLDSAILAYNCATYRPYHLASEFDLAVRDDSYDPDTDYAESAWSPYVAGFTLNPATVPSGWNNRYDFSRILYDKSGTWTEPTTLKTREKLPFLYAAALLYEITSDTQYLDTAVDFADSIQDRQFVDWQNPIEGVYGNFYEFEGDDTAFATESGQAGSYHMGNIDMLSVTGFVKLLQLAPENPNAAKWLNVVRTYTDDYVKQAAALNPLGIHPIGVYKDTTYGGVKFFMTLLHGATGHYGQAASQFLELGSFLNDRSLGSLAAANLNFYTGLNPGIPSGPDSWTAATMINQVGPFYYNTGGEGIKGGVVNGFKAGANWTLYPISAVSDQPDLEGGQEDWVAHSHPYVGGAARLEADYRLTIQASDNGAPVSASVTVALPESHAYSIGGSGSAVITDLPLNRAGTISVTYGGRTITKHLETVGGGAMLWNVDFDQYADTTITVPATLAGGASGTGTLTVTNRGASAISGNVDLSASGVTLGASSVAVSVASGASQNYTFGVTGGAKVMPYLVYGSLNLGSGKLFLADGTGKVGP